MLWLYLTHEGLLSHGSHILHFAPEPGIALRLDQPGFRYVKADLSPQGDELQVDITDMPFREATFDAVLCIHVLEHVHADTVALREIHRVLRPGGWAIIQVPMFGEQTVEDPTVIAPEDRLRHFGQRDHVRTYGRDFETRLREAGFDVQIVPMRDRLSARQIRRYGLSYSLASELGFDLNDVPSAWEIWRVDKP